MLKSTHMRQMLHRYITLVTWEATRKQLRLIRTDTTQMQRIIERLLTLVTSQVLGKQRLLAKTHAYINTCAANATETTISGNLGSVWKTTTFRHN
jgi:hypothetical protein